MTTAFRSLVLRETRLQVVPGLPAIRLYLADDILRLWRAVQIATGDEETGLPYWGFAWGGGLALAHFLRARPDAVTGKRVLDLGAGSGLVAIAAMQAGATRVAAAHIDTIALAAIAMNAKANQLRIGRRSGDILDEPPPDVDVILAGDSFYEAGLAERVGRWLTDAHERGIEVFIGDPGRRHLPTHDLVGIASYEVRTTTDLEDLARMRGDVYTFSD